MKIGIVGYGEFTRLMIKHLQDLAEVIVLSRDVQQNKQGMKFRFADAPEVLTAEYVILSIPAQFLESFLQEHAQFFTKHNVVIDVCSIKQAPIETMLKHLPKNCQLLGSHPIFGPGSANAGLANLQIVLTPVRIQPKPLHAIKRFLEDLQLEVLFLSAQEHDKQIAYVLGLTQYVGRLMQNMNIPNTQITTPAYDYLKSMRDVQGKDSWDLFESIVKLPESRSVIEDLHSEIAEIDKKLN